MILEKCPRCDLNYIMDGEKYCKVCQREMKGEPVKEELELCSVCNEAPALPGKDVCLFCLKEMDGAERDDEENEVGTVDESHLGIEAVSTMDEIIPEINEDIPREFGEIENELSLESVREEEENDDEEDEEI